MCGNVISHIRFYVISKGGRGGGGGGVGYCVSPQCLLEPVDRHMVFLTHGA